MNNNYCKKCRLRDGCIRKCKEAEVYEQGYNDAYDEIIKAFRMCKQIKNQNETTMEKELKIIPPIGYEIDRQKSTFEKIIFKKIPENPKTWEEYCKLTKGNTSNYANTTLMVCKDRYTGTYNEFSTKERAEQFIALGKLLQLRDYWVQRSKFKDAIGVFTLSGGIIATHEFDIDDYALTFPTQEMADKFIKCFSDLILKASPLV